MSLRVNNKFGAKFKPTKVNRPPPKKPVPPAEPTHEPSAPPTQTETSTEQQNDAESQPESAQGSEHAAEPSASTSSAQETLAETQPASEHAGHAQAKPTSVVAPPQAKQPLKVSMPSLSSFDEAPSSRPPAPKLPSKKADHQARQPPEDNRSPQKELPDSSSQQGPAEAPTEPRTSAPAATFALFKQTETQPEASDERQPEPDIPSKLPETTSTSTPAAPSTSRGDDENNDGERAVPAPVPVQEEEAAAPQDPAPSNSKQSGPRKKAPLKPRPKSRAASSKASNTTKAAQPEEVAPEPSAAVPLPAELPLFRSPSPEPPSASQVSSISSHPQPATAPSTSSSAHNSNNSTGASESSSAAVMIDPALLNWHDSADVSALAHFNNDRPHAAPVLSTSTQANKRPRRSVAAKKTHQQQQQMTPATNHGSDEDPANDDRDGDFDPEIAGQANKRLRFADQEDDGEEIRLDGNQQQEEDADEHQKEEQEQQQPQKTKAAPKRQRKSRAKPVNEDGTPKTPAPRRKRKARGAAEGEAQEGEEADNGIEPPKKRKRAKAGGGLIAKPKKPTKERDSQSLTEDPTPIDPATMRMTDLTIDRGQGRMTNKALEAAKKKSELKAKKKRIRDKMRRRAKGEEVSEDEVEEEEEAEGEGEQQEEDQGDGIQAETLPGEDDEEEEEQAEGEAEGRGQEGGEGEDEEPQQEGGDDDIQEVDAEQLFTETNMVAGVRMQDGEIVLDDETMLVSRDATDADAGAPIVDASLQSRRVTSASYSNRRKASRWTADDTQRFYEALQKFGPNLELIALCFPSRDRAQIRGKWKREDKLNPDKITKAMMAKAPLDMEDVERETGLDLSGPTPEDPMEPYYFDRPGGPAKALPTPEPETEGPVVAAPRPAAPQPKPPPKKKSAHKIKGLNKEQQTMLDFVESEVVED